MDGVRLAACTAAVRHRVFDLIQEMARRQKGQEGQVEVGIVLEDLHARLVACEYPAKAVEPERDLRDRA